MEGILEQILAELKEINAKLSYLEQQQKSKSIALAKTAETLPDVVTVSDIKKYLNIGITKAFEIIGRKEFTKLRIGRKTCIPKEQFLTWCVREYHKKAIGLKNK